MVKIFEYNPEIDLAKHIIWQYGNANAIISLIEHKSEWYNVNQKQFWSDWIKDVLTISTANDYGLSIWGNLLQVPRTYNIEGVMTTLETEQYRLLLRGRLLYLRMNGSTRDINQYLHLLFEKDGVAFVRDNLDMTMTYVLDFAPTREQLVVLLNTCVLPRPAGVGYKIYVLPDTGVFGFSGSDWVGFNQAPFWNGIDIGKKVSVKA